MMLNLDRVRWSSKSDKAQVVLMWGQRLYVLFVTFYVIGLGFYKGTVSEVPSQRIVLPIAGVVGGILLFALALVMDLGIYLLGKFIDWLSNQIRTYPKIRRWGIASLGIVVGVATLLLVIYSDMNLWFKFVLAIFGLLSLSALVSMLDEDRLKEKTYLANHQVTRGFVLQHPQAAIETAFTLFEDKLRQRLGVGAEIYGDNLINLAFGKNGRLTFGITESEKLGTRSLVSGAYAAIRNPRKHRVIQDDEKTVSEIMALVELLVHIVDESEECSCQHVRCVEGGNKDQSDASVV